MRRTRAFAAAGALLALASCGAGSSLEGSLGDQVSLAFDEVQIERSANAVAVIYLHALPGGGGKDTVLKVVASTAQVALDRAASLDLTEQVGSGPSLRGSFVRAVSGDARHDFPPLVHGKLTFDGPVAAGAHASGNFTALFGQGGSLGAGRTAFGDFSATVTEAGQ